MYYTEPVKDQRILSLFKKAMKEKYAQDSNFVFTRCVEKHVGEAIRGATGALNWSDRLVWTAHSIRHGKMSEGE